jgi:hypothetical protein
MEGEGVRLVAVSPEKREAVKEIGRDCGREEDRLRGRKSFPSLDPVRPNLQSMCPVVFEEFLASSAREIEEKGFRWENLEEGAGGRAPTFAPGAKGGRKEMDLLK